MVLVCLQAFAGPRVATLELPGPPRFAKLARDVTAVVVAVDPSVAANAGLFEDAARVPSFSAEAVAALVARLDADLAALDRLPSDRWPVDSRIDLRWIEAQAELTRHALVVDRMHERRPGQWLEPVSNSFIALLSYAPERVYLQERLWAQLPAMLAEMRRVCTAPTRRDAATGARLARALAAMAAPRPVAAELERYATELEALRPEREFAVVGAESYAWRLEHGLLLPWTPAELLALAEADLAAIDARIAAFPPVTPALPTAEQQARVVAFDQAALVALYDRVSEAHRAATERAGWVSVPATVGPIRARPTPPALVPLTGDGGSMNPPPTFGDDPVGWWNVDTVRPDWSEARRLDQIVALEDHRRNGFGPYAAHEAFPGHHLQLSLARLNPDPLRSVLMDSGLVEGWALYAEEVFHAHGGLGDDPAAELAILRSYRSRIARVVYDVRIETGAWSLAEGMAFKRGAPAEPDEDLLRSINWPTQLVAYYAGKKQLVALREELRARQGAAFDERAFHDAVLAEGSIPVALIRAKLLGEALP